MKYRTAQNMAAELRWLADFIESDGIHLPSEFGWSDPEVRLSIYFHSAVTKKKVREAVKSLASQGVVKKNFEDTYSTITKNFGKFVKIVLIVNRAQVCTPRIVGTKQVEEKVLVSTGKMITQDVVEWDCSPILED